METASSNGLIMVRDTKDRGAPALAFRPKAWQSFAADLKDGRFRLRR